MTNDKGSEIKAKGAEILSSTQNALATGVETVTDKTKQGMESAADTAANIKTATGQVASDTQTKVTDAAHNAQCV